MHHIVAATPTHFPRACRGVILITKFILSREQQRCNDDKFQNLIIEPLVFGDRFRRKRSEKILSAVVGIVERNVTHPTRTINIASNVAV